MMTEVLGVNIYMSSTQLSLIVDMRERGEILKSLSENPDMI